jgi:hypothetical protein
MSGGGPDSASGSRSNRSSAGCGPSSSRFMHTHLALLRRGFSYRPASVGGPAWVGRSGGIARGRLNDRPFRRAASEPFNLSPTIGMQPARHGRCIDVATRGRFRTPIRHPADATSVPPDPAPRGGAQKRTYRRSACPALLTLSALNCKNITVAELLLLHVAEMTATILPCNSHDPPES